MRPALSPLPGWEEGVAKWWAVAHTGCSAGYLRWRWPLESSSHHALALVLPPCASGLDWRRGRGFMACAAGRDGANAAALRCRQPRAKPSGRDRHAQRAKCPQCRAVGGNAANAACRRQTKQKAGGWVAEADGGAPIVIARARAERSPANSLCSTSFILHRQPWRPAGGRRARPGRSDTQEVRWAPRPPGCPGLLSPVSV